MTVPSADLFERRCREMAKLWTRFGDHADDLIRLGSMPSTAIDGWPSSSIGPEVRSTSDQTVPERAASSEPPTDLVKQWLTELFDLSAPALRCTRRMAKLESLISRRADVRVRDTGAGVCLACGRDVPGTANDRMRGGHCEACRKAWDRLDLVTRNLAVFRWARFRAREEGEGREPSWSTFKALQEEAS